MSKKALTLNPYPIFIILAAILWAIDGVLRRSLFSLPPATIVFYEHLIGSLIIAPLVLPNLKSTQLNSKDWFAIITISLVSGLLGTLWFTTALVKTQYIPFSVVFLIQKLQPLFAISTAAFILQEKLSPAFIKWASVALLAAYFVTFPGGIINLQTGGQTLTAALYALGAAIAWGSATAISRYALIQHSHTLITGLRFFITTLFALVFVTFARQLTSLPLITSDQLLRLLIIALSTGLVSIWMYYKGLKHTSASHATILELAFPLTAVFIDLSIFHNSLVFTQYLAATILFFAIFRISALNSSHE